MTWLLQRAAGLRRLLWLVLLWSPGAFAQGTPLAVGNAPSYALSRAFSYLDDSSAAMTLESVLAPAAQARFIAVTQVEATTNFGATHSAIWLRVQLQAGADAPAQWLLELANPALDRLDLYVSNGAGGFEHQAGGDSVPYADRVVPHRHHVKPVRLQPGVVTTVYLRIASLGTVSAPATLWQPAALWQRDQQTYAVFGLYFGLLLGLLLYNLLLYLSVRDRAYLIYVGFTAFMGLSQAANSGLAAQFLWPGAVWWNNVSINAMNALAGTFGLLFACSFLASRTTMPRLDRWMRLSVGLWVAAFFGALLLPYRAGVWSVTLLALVGVGTVALAAVLAIRRRHPGAPYFALAWGALLLGVLVLTLHNNGFLPSNAITANALLIGSALEMVLLSFALADRINTARKDKELAQAQMESEHAVVQALQQSQEHYRAVIEHVAEGMMVVQDERFVFVNARAADILESTRGEIMARGAMRAVHPEDRAALTERARRRMAGEPVAERIELRLVLRDRPVKWLELGDATVPWDGRLGLLVFFLDVTQRHQAELDTRNALARQQELNALRSRFVAMTSHEFRTPLATILSSQDLLRHYHERLPPAERLELLGVIEAGVHRMTRMLDRVLLLGKAEAHMLEFQPVEIDLRALCETLVEEARSLEGATHGSVLLDFEAQSGGHHYDEKLLRHILGNLLSNGLKYSPQGGMVCLQVRVQDDAAVFEVTDEGIGIPAAELPHLFESFHRASNVGSIAGTGLGLAIVKNAVDLHGGTIAVASREGQGTSFTVRLGLHPSQAGN